MRLSPRRAYVSESPATFAQVQANARARGEVALSEDAWLNPPRDTPVPDTEDT